MKPRCWYDLVIEVAIVRPGPIQGNMVHPYLRRRSGEEPVTYPNKEIERVLHKTMGVPIFQEQAMRLAVVAAGFTPGEADQLRRAMGAWRKTGVIEKFRQKLLEGMRSNGLDDEFADQVFRQIRGFGEYGFPESHAASFALLVYVSAFLKHYYPEAFCAAILNSLPMGFYAPAQLIRNAKEHDVEVRPIDVNHSDWDCTLENSADGSRKERCALRLGLRLISGLRADTAEKIMAARRSGIFTSMSEFTRRTEVSRAAMAKLSSADAFLSLKRDRRSALWESLAQERTNTSQPLFNSIEPEDDPFAELPQMSTEEEVYADYQTVGFSLRSHPLSFYREQLSNARFATASDLQILPNESYVKVAGLVLMRQRPSTAKGVTFVTLEDETGVINLVIFQNIWDRYYKIAKRSPAWVAYGKLERKDEVIHVIVQRIEDFSERMEQLETKSRDFR